VLTRYRQEEEAFQSTEGGKGLLETSEHWEARYQVGCVTPGRYWPCISPGWVYVVALEAQIPTWGERGERLEEEVGEGGEEECADTYEADVCIFAGIFLRISELHRPFCIT